MTSPIPPLNPLRTFEVAARLCSLTLAAEELNVSQVAVSRQVKTLEDYLGVTLFRRLHRGVERKAVDRIIGLLGLAPYADRRAGTLSLGNAQRLGLAKAMLHRPQLLILDEPANGLDPAGIVEIRHLLLELVRNEGVTVFMSSHILGEVSRLAHRIGIIHQGRLIQELDVEALERNRRRRLLIHTRNDRAACAILTQAGLAPQFTAAGAIAVLDESAIAHPDKVATDLVKSGQAPTMLNVEQEDLEQYFLRLVSPVGEREQQTVT